MGRLIDKLSKLSKDDQVKVLAQTLEHQSRRLHKTTIYGAPIIPVSGYLAKENGTLLRHMLGLPCALISGAIYIEECKGVVVATMRIEEPTQTWALDFSLRRGLTVISRPTSFEAGTRITITVTAVQPENLFGIWVTLVMKPELPRQAVEQFLLEELEKGRSIEESQDLGS